MPKASPLQPSFSGGEWSPKVQGRTDNERSKTAAATITNYLPTTEGPLIRRPGFNYTGANVKDPSKPPNFIEFKFSQTQNYVLEFGDQYMRIFTNQAQITTTSTHFKVSGYYGTSDTPIHSSNFYAMRSSPLQLPGELMLTSSIVVSSTIFEIQTPYIHPDVFDLKVSQKEDTLFIVHSSYPTYKLQRFGNETWQLKHAFFIDGPYLPINTYKTPGDSLNVLLAAGIAPFIVSPANVNQYDLVTGPIRTCSSVFISGTSNLHQVVTAGSHNFQTGDKVVIRGVAGASQVNNGTSTIASMFWEIIKINNTAFELVGSASAGFAYSGSGYIYPALFQPLAAPDTFNDVDRTISLIRADGGRAWGTIDTVTDMSRARVIVDGNFSPLVTGTSLTTMVGYWQLSPWSPLSGYANAIALHQDRLFLSGTPQRPSRFDASVISEYENFQASGSSGLVTDKNALNFNVAADQLDVIKWLKSDVQGLLGGSMSTEWCITPNNQGGALTPTTINAKNTSDFGSHNAAAVKAGNATLYVQAGQRRVRELNYFYQVDSYRSTDLSELADHMTASGIKKLMVQREPISVIWGLREDGQLICMCYGRDDQALKVGWARASFGGASDTAGTAPIVRSAAVIPSPDGSYDQLWCSVQRFINGTSVVTIETMQPLYSEESKQEDAALLDCAGFYDSPVTITGISSPGSAVVTAAAHGFSNGDSVLITKVIGLNSSITDINGVIHTSSLVNYRSFTVASTSTNAFWLQDFGSSFINTNTYGVYFSGGEVRKLVTSVSGLTWLKNETVDILADGKIHGQAIVNSAGVVTLSYGAAKVRIGYAYNSDGRSLRTDAGSGDGTSIGKMQRVSRAAFLLRNVGDFSIGPAFDKLTPMSDISRFQADNTPADQAPPLFSGIARESVASNFDFNGQICWRQSSPLPGMVQSLTKIIEENDV